MPSGSPADRAPRGGAGPYADGAPPGHTGGFGEPTCVRCHFEAAAPPEGRLAVGGFPRTWKPGREYPLEVRLTSPGMRRAGFQLSVRFGDGRQAGSLRAPAPGIRIVEDSAGVRYAGHAESGAVEEGLPAVWRVVWCSPTRPGERAVLHVAANAANGDDSEFGDAIYTDSLASEPGGERAATGSVRSAARERGGERCRANE